MKDYIEERVILLAQYITEHKSTVRETAARFGVSKSTVHKDVTDRLRHINSPLYNSVAKILENNKEERHIRGGNATREKYLRNKITQNGHPENI